MHLALESNEPEGQENLKRLVARADILIETYAPGEMDAWGIGYRQLRELNPGLVYVAISPPYGHYTSKATSVPANMPWT